MTRITGYLIAALTLALSACTNPYDPAQNALGDGLLGAGTGAAIGAAAGGGPGAALGAAIGVSGDMKNCTDGDTENCTTST
jgi:hypothetical protein